MEQGNDTARAFSDWLRNEIERRDWTVAHFARRAGTVRQTAWAWVQGTRLPDPPSCERIAAALGYDVRSVMVRAGHLRDGTDLTRLDVMHQLSAVQRELRGLAELGEEIERESGRIVPVRGRVPADSIRWTEDEGLRPVRVDEEDLNGARNPFGLIVTGPCMQAIGIFPTDVLILERDPNRRPVHRELVVIRTADGVTFKRWCVVSRTLVELRDGDESVAATLNPLMDDYEVEGFFVTFKPRAKR